MKRYFWFKSLLLFVFVIATGPLQTAELLAGVDKYRPKRATKRAAQAISESQLLGHVRFLSSDLLGGRGPATAGDQLTQSYLASQFEALGLEPAGDDGTWFQPFDIVGLSSEPPANLRLWRGNKSISLKYLDDYVAKSGEQKKTTTLTNAELVFVGFGIVAPEYDWNDYKDVDVRGKVLLMLNSDPQDDPKIFAGKTRLYYGRWTYKYEIAAKMGAAGAIVIHTIPSAGYPWGVVRVGFSGERFMLPSQTGPVTKFRAWVSGSSAEKIAKLAGKDLAKLTEAAKSRDFRPVPLGVKLSANLKNKLRRVRTANVVAKLTGSDPKLSKEAVVYSAHHDHLGTKKATKKGEDVIYNGAMDNAAGTAGLLAIAKAFTTLPKPPARSVVFAAVGAEESGLLGSAHFARNPVVPPGRIAANINIDGANIWGRTRDITMIGFGKSTLDERIVSIAAMQGRVVKPDQFPDRGYFYRSDQFSFAKIGVPAAYFHRGTEAIGKPAGEGKRQMEEWISKHYHKPSDELDASWDLSGAVEDFRLNFYLGYEVARAKSLPAWNPGDEFEAARLQALRDLESTTK